jgi:hypothetical protein
MSWSMDCQGIRTWFDRESRRLKQVEPSGLLRERVSLRTYANELSARDAEVCRDAKYGDWCDPAAAPAAGRPTRLKLKSGNGSATVVKRCERQRIGDR